METNLIDELFAQINKLTEENSKLKETNAKLQKDILLIESKKELDDDVKETNDNMNVDSTGNTVKKEIREAEEVEITFFTNDSYNKLYIMGDFTNWEMRMAQKVEDKLFVYNTWLLKGFKYYYCYLTDDQVVVDFSNLYEENPKTLQLNNIIILPDSENNLAEYEFSLHNKILEDSKRECLVKRIGTQAEIELLEKAIDSAKNTKGKIEKLVETKNAKLGKIKAIYE